jgi:uncharacterized protein (DUF4415 family)
MSQNSTSNKSQTDWDKLDNMSDDEIDFSDVEEITPELFAQAVVRHGLKPVPKKEQITLRVDSDVLHWFRSQGKGYQTKINDLLRAYMNAHGRR